MINQEFQKLIDEYNQLNKDIQVSSITKDPKRLEQISKRLSYLSPIIENIQKLTSLEEELAGNKELLSAQDEDIKKLAEEDSASLKLKIERLALKITNTLKKSDPNDKRNVIVEIRAGTGGEEAALFARDLFRMYSRYAEKNNWKVEVMNTNYTGTGGYKEIIFSIKGNNVYGKLKFESGVHRVQRIPETESSGRIHTSAASVVILPEIDDIEVTINPEEIKIDVFRAGGPGGQSVNTTDSAVRITHLPTSISVSCQDEKSQHKNKARAMSILKSKIFEFEKEKQSEETAGIRKQSIKTGDRSAKIKTYNFPEGRVSDHRIKKTWYNLQRILDGELEEVITTVQDNINEK